MAIINSIIIGKARKSAGNVTFRYVHGRTILSEKIMTRRVNTDGKMPGYSFTFALLNRFAAMHKEDVNLSFNSVRYGTPRNYFVKVNYHFMRQAFQPLYQKTQNPSRITDEAIEEAVTTYAKNNPNTIFRVHIAGYPIAYLNDAWSSEQNPVGVVTLMVDGVPYTVTVATAPGGTPVELTGSFRIRGKKIGKDVTGVRLLSAKQSYTVAAPSVSDNEITFEMEPGESIRSIYLEGSNPVYLNLNKPDGGNGSGSETDNPLG